MTLFWLICFTCRVRLIESTGLLCCTGKYGHDCRSRPRLKAGHVQYRELLHEQPLTITDCVKLDISDRKDVIAAHRGEDICNKNVSYDEF